MAVMTQPGNIIDALHNNDERIKGIRFSRNFGHQYALFAGMQHASGKAVVTMDGDLQHPPELLPEMLERWRAGDRIVHTIRVYSNEQGFLKRASSDLFYRLFSFLSGVEMESGMADFRLLDRQVLDELLKFKEEGLFLRGIVHWVGYQSSKLDFQCGQRFSGKGKYNVRKMLKLAWTGITSFSLVPLRVSIIHRGSYQPACIFRDAICNLCEIIYRYSGPGMGIRGRGSFFPVWHTLHIAGCSRRVSRKGVD